MSKISRLGLDFRGASACIAFCLNTHNKVVKALRYPPDAHNKELKSVEKQCERQQQGLELAKHIVEEYDDEF